MDSRIFGGAAVGRRERITDGQMDQESVSRGLAERGSSSMPTNMSMTGAGTPVPDDKRVFERRIVEQVTSTKLNSDFDRDSGESHGRTGP